MDLRTGQTVWQAMGERPITAPPLSAKLDCDVLVVGGGITGAFVAYALAQAGIECALIEGHAGGAGSTLASTALVLYELDTHLVDLAQRMDPQRAAQCYLACCRGVRLVQDLATSLGAAQMHSRHSFYFAENSGDVPILERECRARQNSGIEVEWIERREIEAMFSFSRPAALASPGAIEINPVELMRLLFGAAEKSGLQRFGETKMLHHDYDGKWVRVSTDQGNEIRCRCVVFATGYDSEKHLSFSVAKLKSTFVIATEAMANIPGWYEQSLLWTSARPYWYLRTTNDGRALMGGADIDACRPEIRDARLPEKAAQLGEQLRELFPSAPFVIANAWAGTFAETEDSLAYIGKVPDLPWAYFALGYGGNGITYSALAAEIIRDLHRGRRNPLASLFGFDRLWA
jgi:glycine/D-amino acid oxidase-like deaminating enzyme